MKTLSQAQSQLPLFPRRRDLVHSVVEPSARQEILRALAEILLVAAEVVEREEERDETR
jgi:hypothetical protein